jgi:hypothetical protein
MNKRQAMGGDDMVADDWQLAVPVVQQTPAEQPRIHLKIFSAQPAFDCHFPYTGRAKKKLVSRIVDQGSSRRGSPAAQSRRCVSSRSFMHHRRTFARSPPCPSGQSRPAQRSAPP